MAATGTLYGLGVGPGDPELLTVKAMRLLQAAPGRRLLRRPQSAGRRPPAFWRA